MRTNQLFVLILLSMFLVPPIFSKPSAVNQVQHDVKNTEKSNQPPGLQNKAVKNVQVPSQATQPTAPTNVPPIIIKSDEAASSDNRDSKVKLQNDKGSNNVILEEKPASQTSEQKEALDKLIKVKEGQEAKSVKKEGNVIILKAQKTNENSSRSTISTSPSTLQIELNIPIQDEVSTISLSSKTESSVLKISESKNTRQKQLFCYINTKITLVPNPTEMKNTTCPTPAAKKRFFKSLLK